MHLFFVFLGFGFIKIGLIGVGLKRPLKGGLENWKIEFVGQGFGCLGSGLWI